MSDSEERSQQNDKPRITLPKIGGFGNAPKPPPPPNSATQKEIADVNEQPDLEQYSFFHWNSDAESTDPISEIGEK